MIENNIILNDITKIKNINTKYDNEFINNIN